ncbi:Redoxin [Pirellulimonas nuda]|uniref:Redoxin n=1 Tax=Pirellulimonas nuda TaxID=2528009 RepID=A0A518D8J2_9BACT|nr:redoxin family protein [Pirellulimonas nuda]QDU87797.1 Redoxin [Pirellulimonas nuda]
MKKPNLIAFWLVLLAICASTLPSDAQQPERQRQRQRRQAPAGKEAPHPPKVGDEAPAFELPKLNAEKKADDKTTGDDALPTVTLEQINNDGPVVLLVLRGWPGYQCPICSRQVGQFLSRSEQLAKQGVQLVLVYPGPADLLAEHAREFQGDRSFPAGVHYLIDPDYAFTNAWGLRWEAPRETAYASTFIIGKDGLIKFGNTSTTHGDRVDVETVLEELAGME